MFPCIVRLGCFENLTKTQYRIRKDVDLSALKIDNSFTTNQRQVFPWIIFPNNCFQSRDLILLRHQSRRYVEHLFECEICCVRDGLTIVQVICFVVDLVEELIGEGGSRSSWRFHEHDSYQLVSQQNVAIRVFWSRCQPRLTLSAQLVSKQRVSPFYRDLFLLPNWSSCCRERNVFEALAQSKTGLPVLSWFTFSSKIGFWLSREKRGWDARSEQTTGLSSLSWFGFGFGWVGWELFACRASSPSGCRATSPSGCRATSEPNSFIQSCFKEILGGGRGGAYTFRIWLLQFPSAQLSGYNRLGVFREEWWCSIV